MLQVKFAFTNVAHVVTTSTILNVFARNVRLYLVLNIVTLTLKHVDVNVRITRSVYQDRLLIPKRVRVFVQRRPNVIYLEF